MSMMGIAILLYALGNLFSGVGDTYEELRSGDKVYRNVEIRRITPQSLIVSHDGGIAQLLLSELPEEIQGRYGYDAEGEKAWLAERREKEKEVRAAISRPVKNERPKPRVTETLTEELLVKFGTPATCYEAIDMRPIFSELDLYVKRQGLRPSCAVFAVVSALEYQHARVTGEALRLSEEYLVWATRKSLGIPPAGDPNFDPVRDGDLGFSLQEVVQALKAYGIPEHSLMPNTYGKGMAAIHEPGPEVIEEARRRRQVTATMITGRSGRDQINNIVHVLNRGVPVVVGMGWPPDSTLRRAPVLSKQTPVYRHAVTLVGYVCESGNPEEARFLFKNSWGPNWGMNGHGWVTYEYLEKYLMSAVFLDIVSSPDA